MATDTRRRILEAWLAHRARPPTPASLLRAHARPIGALTLLLLATVGPYAGLGDRYWTGGAIGFAFATLLGLAQKLRLAALTWPTSAEFLDWPRVERAARESGLDVPPPPGGMVE